MIFHDRSGLKASRRETFTHQVMLVLLAGILLGGIACKSSGNMKDKDGGVTLWVNSTKLPCEKDGSRHCFEVQELDSLDEEKWVLREMEIQGFTYEPGNLYKLRVRIPDPDSPSVYDLVSIDEKRSDSRLLIHDIWMLTTVGGEAIDTRKSRKPPYIEIHVAEKRVLGSGMCNRFSGTVHVRFGNQIRFERIVSTKMGCPQLKTESRIFKYLQQSQHYRIDEGKLYLMGAEDDQVLLEFRKGD